MLPSLPIAAVVTNYHKLNGIKQYGLIVFPSWRSEVQKSFLGLKSRHQQSCVPSGDSRGRFAFLPFTASRSHCIPCFTFPSFHLQSQQHSVFCALRISDLCFCCHSAPISLLLESHRLLFLYFHLISTLVITSGPPTSSGIISLF